MSQNDPAGYQRAVRVHASTARVQRCRLARRTARERGLRERHAPQGLQTEKVHKVLNGYSH